MSDITTKSQYWTRQAEAVRLPNDLLGGTPAMRKAGQAYLRKGSAEHQEDYELRLNSTILTDAYKRTLNFMTGQVFQKDIILEDATEDIKAIAENIDSAGNNISVFSAGVFKFGVHAGVSFILVDFSKVTTRVNEQGKPEFLDEATEEWLPRTEAVAKERGWRPYWVHVKAQDVIDIKTEVVAGTEVITHFRYYEPREVQDGEWSTEIKTDRVRVLKPGTWAVWEKAEGEKGEWSMVDSGTMPFDEVPVAVFMPGEPQGDKTAIPALQGLAYLCETHWQATSGHRHLMDWVRRPAFFGKMLGIHGESVAFGPNRLVQSHDPSADLKSVGVDVGSVQASQSDLEKLEAEMSMYGLRLLMPNTGNVTATQHALESAESSSALKLWAKAFKDCLERAFEFTAQWQNLGREKRAGVVISDDFIKMFDTGMASIIVQAVSASILPKEMAFDALRTILPVRDDIDWQEAKAMMEDDNRAGTGGAGNARELANKLLFG